MNRVIKYTLLPLIAILLFVSCNIDSTEGLIQAAATAVNVIDYNSSNVIGRSGDKLIVATDKGICTLDSNGNYSLIVEGGNLAIRTVYADDSHYVFFDEETNSFKAKKYNGDDTVTQFSTLDGKTLKGIFSNNGIDFTYVLEEGSKTYAATYNTSVGLNLKEVEDNKQLAIVGPNTYAIINSGKNEGIALYKDGTWTTYNNASSNRVAGAIEKDGTIYAIDIKGKIYIYNSANEAGKLVTDKGTSSSTSRNFVPMIATSNGVLYIYPGDSSSNIISLDGSKVEKHSNTSMGSTLPRLIVGYNSTTAEYLVINESSGAYLLKPGASFTELKESSSISFSDFN